MISVNIYRYAVIYSVIFTLFRVLFLTTIHVTNIGNITVNMYNNIYVKTIPKDVIDNVLQLSHLSMWKKLYCAFL